MKTKITIICENCVRVPLNLTAEHGLSMLIEKDDTTLYDTGQGMSIINNLENMGKTAAGIDRIVLSHGHYDHTGGLLSVLKQSSGKLPVFLNPAAFIEKCAYIQTGGTPIEKPIGMKYSREEYEEAGAEFNLVTGFANVTRGITAISDIKHPEGWQTWDSRLKQKKGGNICDDPFYDDLSLLVDTESGPVVLLGCAHAGIVEILENIAERSGHREFHAVIGGTHLESAPEDYVDKTIETLRKYKVKKVAAAHCTGFKITCRFAREFANEFAPASVGTVFEF